MLSNVSPPQKKIDPACQACNFPLRSAASYSPVFCICKKTRSVTFPPSVNFMDPDRGDFTHELGTLFNEKWLIRSSLFDLHYEPLPRTFDSGMGHGVTSLIFSPNGRQILIANAKGISLGNSRSGTQIQCVNCGSPVHTLAFSPDGQFFLSGHEDGEVRLWSAIMAKVESFRNHEGPVYSVAFSQDGQFFVSGGKDGGIHVYNTLTKKEIACFEGELPLRKVAFSLDRKKIFLGYENRNPGLLDIDRQRLIPNFTVNISQIQYINRRVPVRASYDKVAFSPNGEFSLSTPTWSAVMSASSLLGVHLWEVATGQLKYVFNPSTNHNAFAFSPCGQYFISSDWNNKISLIEVKTGLEVKHFSFALDNSIISLAFHPNGRYLLSVDRTGTMYLVDIEKEGVFCERS
jgi:WD40 repeat protein